MCTVCNSANTWVEGVTGVERLVVRQQCGFGMIEMADIVFGRVLGAASVKCRAGSGTYRLGQSKTDGIGHPHASLHSSTIFSFMSRYHCAPRQPVTASSLLTLGGPFCAATRTLPECRENVCADRLPHQSRKPCEPGSYRGIGFMDARIGLIS